MKALTHGNQLVEMLVIRILRRWRYLYGRDSRFPSSLLSLCCLEGVASIRFIAPSSRVSVSLSENVALSLASVLGIRMNPMDGPLLKVERADHHIRELEQIFRRYISANAKAMRPKKHRNCTHRAATLGLRFPRHLPAVIGDAIHNLRVSLDHAYWIMVEDNGGTWHRSIKFPFYDSLKAVEGSVRGQPASTKPNDKVIDFIVNDLQPFPGGRHELYDLHTLDITDKHKLLIPSLAAFAIGGDDRLRLFNGTDWREIVGPTTGEARIVLNINGGGAIFSAPEIQYHGNLQNALSILFGEGEFKSRPVLATLNMLRERVTGAIRGLAELHGSASTT